MEQHGYFDVEGRGIHAAAYFPEDGEVRRAAVLCEPFGEEKRCAYRMLVRLARLLASRGIGVLRCDVSGTGDSAGTHAEATWDAWRAETRAALGFARELFGAASLACLGFRGGALLAADCAEECDRLVLCEPILTGEELFTELERRQKIKDMMSKAAAAPLPGGACDFGGFVLSATMIGQMRKAAVAPASIPAACRVLLLHVSAARKFPPAWEPLVARADARLVADKPFWGQVDYFESDSVNTPIAEFLAEKENP